MPERSHFLDRQPVQVEIFEAVLVLQEAVVVERGLADVDRHDPRAGIRVGEHGRLVRAAAGDQDVEVRPILAVGPEEPGGVGGIEPLPVAGQPRRQVPDRLGIDPLLVLAGNDVGERISGHGKQIPRYERSSMTILGRDSWWRHARHRGRPASSEASSRLQGYTLWMRNTESMSPEPRRHMATLAVTDPKSQAIADRAAWRALTAEQRLDIVEQLRLEAGRFLYDYPCRLRRLLSVAERTRR